MKRENYLVNYFLTGRDNMLQTFKSEIYPIQFVFSVHNNPNEICDFVFEKYRPNDLLMATLKDELSEFYADSWYCHNHHGLIIINTDRYLDSYSWKSTLSHEISHATFFVCERLGIDYTVSPQEAYCYLNGWITEKIYSLIEKDIANI